MRRRRRLQHCERRQVTRGGALEARRSLLWPLIANAAAWLAWRRGSAGEVGLRSGESAVTKMCERADELCAMRRAVQALCLSVRHLFAGGSGRLVHAAGRARAHENARRGDESGARTRVENLAEQAGAAE